MKEREVREIRWYFVGLKDPRVERTKRHLLTDIITVAICGVICGADNWVEIEQFGKAKKEWFKTFLELPGGIPSHDTFGRVFAILDAEVFSQCFIEWVSAIRESTAGEVIAIDGKSLRRSFDKASGKAAIHMVSAWSNENQIILGQVKTEEKSNEITAIPKLLGMLELSGGIVTIDAMGCQKKIASHIVSRGADYVLSLKGNHNKMSKEVEDFFTWAEASKYKDFGSCHDYTETIEKGHGRVELRRYKCTSYLDWFKGQGEWKGLKSFGMVESERCVGTERSVERRFYISSLSGRDAKTFARAVRGHWGIENKLHWVLDMVFREDENRIRKGHSAANFATLRHIALNLLKQEKTVKIGIKAKRLKSGWDESYLLKVLGV